MNRPDELAADIPAADPFAVTHALARTIIGHSTAALLVVGSDGVVAACSAAAAERLGRSVPAVVGLDIGTVLPILKRRDSTVATEWSALLNQGRLLAQTAAGEPVISVLKSPAAGHHDGNPAPGFLLELEPDAVTETPAAREISTALDPSLTGIWIWDPRSDALEHHGDWPSRWRHGNDGHTPDTGQKMLDCTHPDDIADTLTALRAHLRGETSDFEARQRIRNRFGEFDYVQSHGKIVERDEAGRATRLIGTYTDVREIELRSSRLNAMLEGGGQGVWEYEPATDLVRGYGFSGLGGLTEKLSLPMTALDIVNSLEPAEGEKILDGIRAIYSGASDVFDVQFRVQRGDGTYAHFLARARVAVRDAANRVERLFGTCTDVTALVAGDEMLRIALENGRQGTWVWYPEQDRIELSSHWYALMGHPAGSIRSVRKGLDAVIHPHDITRAAAGLIPMLKGQRDDYELELRFRHHNGNYLWILARGRCIERNAAGRAVCVVGSHADITEAKQRQHQLSVIADAMTSGSESRLLNALTRAAAELSGMQFAAITLINDDDSCTVTSAYPRDGGLIGYNYAIATSPCSFSLTSETQYIPTGLKSQYPREGMVTAAGLESYVGRRLIDNDGNPCGIFALMDTRPIESERDVLAVLDVFAARATAELQREQTHARLVKQEARLQVALEGSEQLIWEWDAISDEYTVYDSRPTRFETRAMTGAERMRLVHPDDLAVVAEARHAYFRGDRERYEYEARYLDPDGQYRWILCRGKASERDSQGRVTKLIGTHTDISALRTAERQHANARQFLELVLNTVPQYVFWKDLYRVYRGGNASFARFAGVGDAARLDGKTDSSLWWHDDAELFENRDSDLLSGATPYVRSERELELPDGERRWFDVTRVAMHDDDKQITGILGAMIDVTERKRAEDEAQRLALYDPLTELPNRRYLIDRLQSTMASAERHGRCGSLLFIDLDQFKQINDSLGHSIGDKLLTIVARRLRKVTRQEDTVARLGGDEFVVLLPSLGTGKHAAASQSETAAEKIREALAEPYSIGGQTFRVTPTIGIAMFPDAGKSVDDVLKEADTAMYSGKVGGRNAVRFFHEDMEQNARRQMLLERDLRNALDADALALHYQPQVDHAGRLMGAEALLRWTHGARGAIPPAEFIPLAEERGMIVELGYWVLERALADYEHWCAAGDGAMPSLSINVSTRQFQDRQFVDAFSGRIREAGIAPDRILLEITESTAMANVDDSIERMTVLRNLGVRFALDDFGVGYSSLSHLKRLPIDQLKIDHSFIDDIGRDRNDEVICETIIAMGGSLGLQTVAEGIETATQLEFLDSRGCNGFQGYFFMRPAAAEVLAGYRGGHGTPRKR